MPQKKESPVWSKLKSLSISRSGDRAPRYDVNVRVVVESEDHTVRLECRSVNISRTGMLIDYTGYFWPNWMLGNHIQIAIDPDSRFFHEIIRSRAKITRV